uniref:Uncharacterized protein n=1 Tax=Spongospora subterranea TaxID=70186 RepID=A0A0H5R7T1_9EUKA|eukprot:CRZ10235.1 hypothetical protein [Spongospora subterranea]
MDNGQMICQEFDRDALRQYIDYQIQLSLDRADAEYCWTNYLSRGLEILVKTMTAHDCGGSPALSLNLSGWDLGVSGIQSISSTVFRQNHLQVVRLRSTNMSDNALIAMANHLPISLRTLDLSSNRITSDGFNHLSERIRQCSIPLEDLDLSDNPLGDRSVRALCTFMNHTPTLSSLSLIHTNLSGKASEALIKHMQNTDRLVQFRYGMVSLKNCSSAICRYIQANLSLRHLSLPQSSLNDDCVKAIAECLPMSRLQSLNLRDNLITDLGAIALANALGSAKTVTVVDLTQVASSR